MGRRGRAWLKFVLTRLVGLVVDAAVIGFAYLSAFMLRFDFAEPRWGWRAVALSYVTVCAVCLAALIVSGVYRLAWRRTGVADLPRYLLAMTLGAAVLTAMRFFLPAVDFAHIRPPYSVTVISFFLATAGVVGVRVLWRLFWAGRRDEAQLLERSVRQFDNAAAARYFAGKTVMVTGAGGSIGSEISLQVAAAGARRILLVERSENALYEIDRKLRLRGYGERIVPVMKDVGDAGRMAEVFAAERPQVVLHAAAYKHVPMVELNPEEGWRNNTEGTKTLANAAAAAKVERFVLISTDKAVNPVSVMGKTKLAAEQAIMALNATAATSFAAVRFGNVIGSSGSVVPLFREQIAAHRAVTVTHPDMKRYFMTVGEAVSLVLQAASRDERAIYTLDMGEPVRIVDLAERLIVEAGYRPYIDVPIVFTGVRPGEKLFEELDVSERSCYRTDMAKIYITRE